MLICPVLNGELQCSPYQLEQFEGKRVQIREYIPKHSDEARAYYFKAVVSPLADHLGYTKEEMHEVFKGEVLGREYKTVTYKNLAGEEVTHEVEQRKSIKKLKRDEMSHFISECIRLCAENGIVVSPPPYNG